jgi:hypothetical protein
MPLATFAGLRMHVNDPETVRTFWEPTLGSALRAVLTEVVPEPYTVKNRVHLDVVAASLEPFMHLEPVDEPGRFPWTTFHAPEGDDICVFVRDDPGEYRLKAVAVDCVDAEASARWWQGVLGGELSVDDEDCWSITSLPGVPFEGFDFAAVPEPKTVPNRVRWEVRLADGTLDDLVAAGATVLGETELADPEGNEFCLVT